MAFDGGRIVGDVINHPVCVGLPDQGFVHTRGQTAPGELGAGARECRLAGKL